MKILLVNPFASASYLSDEFKRYGIYTIAIYTVDFDLFNDYLNLPMELFDRQIRVKNATTEQIIEALSRDKIDYVINGIESSTQMSDQLTAILTPQYANDVSTSDNRCNKYSMHKCLEQHGLNHIQQSVITMDNYKSEELIFPAFVKPLFGVASAGAMKLNTFSELEDYFTNYKLNLIDFNQAYKQSEELHDEFIFAELVEGSEYLVDTFSVKGIHHICSVQKYTKVNVNGTPRCIGWEIERNVALIDEITMYINQVLTATDFNNGFAHNELFINAKGEAKLIEINSRSSGAVGLIHRLSKANHLPTQVDLLAKHIFGLAIIEPHNKYTKYKVVPLYNEGGHIMPDLHSKISDISGVTFIQQIIKPGNKSAKVIQALSDTAAFVLIGANSDEDLDVISNHLISLDGTWI